MTESARPATIWPPDGAIAAGSVLVAAGVTMLAWDYAILPDLPARYLWYWVGLGLSFGGVVVLGTAARPGPWRQLVSLGTFGAVTWLPYFLRSPDRLLFVDERYHLDVLTRLAEAGHTPLPVTLFPLPGTFPGLENVALTVMSTTGLDPVAASRIVTLTIHIAIPMLAYLVARGLGLTRIASFLAALVYAANTSFVFFHAVFSYESLGVVLFLATWAAIAHYRPARDPAIARRRILGLVVIVAPLGAAIAVTHHASSYALAASLGLAWFVARRRRAPEQHALGVAAILVTAFAALWFVVSQGRVEPYLLGTLSSRVDSIIRALLVEHSQPRALFANSEVPIVERLVAFAYPPLVLLLGTRGVYLLLRRRGAPAFRAAVPASAALSGGLWRTFAIVGPVGWALTTPAVLTRAGEVAYRSWPFLFVGVAAFAAVSLVELMRRVRRPALRTPAAGVLVGVLLVGGFSIGDNQAGRFPTEAPATAGGSANVNQEVIDAARWLRDSQGEGHLIAADRGTETVFGTEGRQRILNWQAWYPFVTDTDSGIVPFLEANSVEFVVVDRQIASLPPRYGTYFGPPEIPADLDPGTPFPAQLLDRFDTIPGLDRIYDSGRIVIYQREPGDAA